jgi:hypothetical protein
VLVGKGFTKQLLSPRASRRKAEVNESTVHLPESEFFSRFFGKERSEKSRRRLG